MKKWNLIIDVEKCENCNNCFLSTKDEHVGNDFPGYAAPQPLHGHEWIRIERKVRGSGHMVDAAYCVQTCNHCDNAPCVKAGRGAVTKRNDGIVIIDPEKARGRRDIVSSCPYGAIWWNDQLQLPQKWIFDAHLLDAGWKEPRCVQSCPTGVFRSLKISDDEMADIAKREQLEVLRSELGTKPRVYYRNLWRFSKWFIGGSVIGDSPDETRCLEGATVTLRKNGKNIATASTDVYGDFKFDHLDPVPTKYQIKVMHKDYKSLELDAQVESDESCYVGDLRLSM
ncbi:4Fe-4S dicluster domain-containing protein [Sedimenticola selenatireducens]|uniref:4Fe-4S dicluster domain-containing protein n=1 Tax=Sedimenticola selenatireducens TaxID=191960 RepID=UPI00048B85BB|nr:4Fe-4S dicluster domain-containing protein [Sedimenticola selenatireducens]